MSVYRTAQGKTIDIDNLRLVHEHVIAVGNQKVNARGDQLGPGGKIVKTRDQVMKEYYALNTPVAQNSPTSDSPPNVGSVAPDPSSGITEADMEVPSLPLATGILEEKPAAPTPTPAKAMRGNLADSISKTTKT